MKLPPIAHVLGQSWLGIALIGSALSAAAQTPPLSAPQNAPLSAALDEAMPTARAPVLAQPDGLPLSLMEAIQRALTQSSSIALQRQEVALQAGVLQSAVGAFDPVLTQENSFTFTEQELTDQAKAAQVTRRTDIQDLIDDYNNRLNDERAVRQELINVRTDPTGATISNPDLAAQIGLLNRLIEAQTDPVIRDELVLQRDNALDADIAESDSEIAMLTSDRDEEIERLRKLGVAPIIDTTYDASVTAGWRKTYRNGWAVDASAQLTLAGTDFKGKRRASEFGGKGVLDLYRTKIGLNLLVPFGRGRTQLSALERSAQFDLNAARAVLSQQLAAVVRDTASAYWQLVAATQRLDLARDSLARQEQIGELTDALIDADQTPASERARAAASRAEANARVVQAQNALTSARLAMADVLSQPVQSLAQAPWPTQGFPPLTRIAPLTSVDAQALEKRALQRRADFVAAIEQSQSAEVLRLAAESELASKHDLTAGMFFTGVAEDSSVSKALQAAVLGKYTGPSLSLGYSYERPWKNDAALGQLAQQRALYTQREIVRAELDRRLRSGVVQALDRLQQNQKQLSALREATEYYLQSVENERERLRAGNTTLINLLLTEERATNVLFSTVAAEAALASALVELRFATGALFSEDGKQVMLDEKALVSLSAAELLAW